jgi:V/A-type H+-transporting ATPase subunit A
VKLKDGSVGSVTVGGTVSPAGGNFEEPVTQATLKVVGAFHGLSRERSDQRRYPAIHPLESWSKYPGVVDGAQVAYARRVLAEGNDVNQMMKVVGEEGTSIDDFVTYLKAEYLDAVYLQQDAYHEVDAATPADRQRYVFERIHRILKTRMKFEHKDAARRFFLRLTQVTKDWNRVAREAPEFAATEAQIEKMIVEVADYA